MGSTAKLIKCHRLGIILISTQKSQNPVLGCQMLAGRQSLSSKSMTSVMKGAHPWGMMRAPTQSYQQE
ncbi:hypothetical protein FGO68_gene4102 [Halteria grandinella]|uniref:Uncharacterized protein n=1 Tax=Halteria grandinella TaxID=5974 RepID=A0A8J8P8X1_HALGN|nr:hypothetical protein FGO68_gene4102 [Halteria grandinella]